MSGEPLFRNVGGERRAQYNPREKAESLHQRADDLRRRLILKYDVRPENIGKAEPRDMWREIAQEIVDRVGKHEAIKGLDAGTSSGYFLEKALELGFSGELYGVDIEARHLPLLRDELSQKFPEARVQLGRSDAESLRTIQLIDGDPQRIPKSYFDFSTANNVLHHTANGESVLNALATVTKPGGLVGFMGRAEGHLHNQYQAGNLVAERFGTNPPQPFYSYSDFYKLEGMLVQSPKFKIISQSPQAEYLWIPDNDEGWRDWADAFYTHLPLMKKQSTGQRLKKNEVQDFVENEIRTNYFQAHASYYNGYFTDYIFQKSFICEIVK